jgi:hypothetical protein
MYHSLFCTIPNSSHDAQTSLAVRKASHSLTALEAGIQTRLLPRPTHQWKQQQLPSRFHTSHATSNLANSCESITTYTYSLRFSQENDVHRLMLQMQSCFAPILHHLTITLSSKYHQSRSITIVQPPITAMTVDVTQSFPMFAQSSMDEPCITTRM